MSLSTVKKPNSLVEKGVPESAGPPSQTTVVLARGQQFEKVAVGVSRVLDDLFGLLLAPILIQFSYRCELTAADFLGSSNYPL